ncbi:MAG TPA: hypothetical protein VIJ25_19045, partial [Methylococcales bacterium]
SHRQTAAGKTKAVLIKRGGEKIFMAVPPGGIGYYWVKVHKIPATDCALCYVRQNSVTAFRVVIALPP